MLAALLIVDGPLYILHFLPQLPENILARHQPKTTIGSEEETDYTTVSYVRAAYERYTGLTCPVPAGESGPSTAQSMETGPIDNTTWFLALRKSLSLCAVWMLCRIPNFYFSRVLEYPESRHGCSGCKTN
jgi:hypothetical protein